MDDLLLALRRLRGRPWFSLTALVVLSVGLGANIAMVALLQAVVFQRLPVPEADRLVVISSADPSRTTEYSSSYPLFLDVRDGVRSFSGVLAEASAGAAVAIGEESHRARAELVSGTFFGTLGVRASLGRVLQPADDQMKGTPTVAVLSHAYWRRLGAAPDIVGRAMIVNGQPFTIVGVAAPGFFGTEASTAVDFWVPMAMVDLLRPGYPGRLESRRHRWLTIMARLAPGVERAQAEAETATVIDQAERAAAAGPGAGAGSAQAAGPREQVRLLPGDQGRAHLRRAAERPLLLLTGATALLLLTACANLAGLVLAHTMGRQREFGVRRALGAPPWRLARQIFSEHLLLALLGGAGGILVGAWVSGFMLGFLPDGHAIGQDAVPSVVVVAATVGLSMVVALLTGALPAWYTARTGVTSSLKSDAPTLVEGGRVGGARAVLSIAQIALAVVLLVTSGAFLVTLTNLRSLDAGFRRDHVLVAALNPTLNGYTSTRSLAFFTTLIEQARSLPGVRSVGASSVSPITGSWDESAIRVPGYQPPEGEEPRVSYAAVSPGFFETLDITLRAGRLLESRDVAGGPLVVVANETMARAYLGGENPVGRQFFFGGDDRPVTIVGVVADGKYVSLREARTNFVYAPIAQAPFQELILHVRTTADPLAIVDLVRDRARRLDPTVPLYGITTMERQIDESLLRERILAVFGTAFALLTLMLAGVGLCGSLAFAVSQRTRELGLRLALGARPSQLGGLVVRQMVALVTAGLCLGSLLALAVGRLAESLLFGVSMRSPLLLLGAAGIIAVVAGIAGSLPAWRAARVDPLLALHAE